MQRYFIQLEFDGSAYHGWQKQPNAPTVEEAFTKTLEQAFQSPIEIVAAGRTDTGVHAKGMVVHIDLDKSLSPDTQIKRLNSMLPADIKIHRIDKVQPEFHARFDATHRTYHYHLSDRPMAINRQYVYYHPFQLDFEQMNAAAELLLGSYDFSCFSKSNTQTYTNDCTVEKAVWKKVDQHWCFEIKANRFLRNMVRAIVGTLIEVGEGKRSVDSIKELIAAKNRSAAGQSVAANGLFLVEVSYPSEGFI